MQERKAGGAGSFESDGRLPLPPKVRKLRSTWTFEQDTGLLPTPEQERDIMLSLADSLAADSLAIEFRQAVTLFRSQRTCEVCGRFPGDPDLGEPLDGYVPDRHPEFGPDVWFASFWVCDKCAASLTQAQLRRGLKTGRYPKKGKV